MNLLLQKILFLQDRQLIRSGRVSAYAGIALGCLWAILTLVAFPLVHREAGNFRASTTADRSAAVAQLRQEIAKGKDLGEMRRLASRSLDASESRSRDYWKLFDLSTATVDAVLAISLGAAFLTVLCSLLTLRARELAIGLEEKKGKPGMP